MDDQKIRHGCLTKWLIFSIIVNSIVLLIDVFSNTITKRVAFPEAPIWVFPLLTLSSILNIIFLIYLFYWKKWAFWGLVGSSVLTFVINLTLGFNLFKAMQGFFWLIILYIVLQLGKENKGWSQLE